MKYSLTLLTVLHVCSYTEGLWLNSQEYYCLVIHGQNHLWYLGCITNKWSAKMHNQNW